MQTMRNWRAAEFPRPGSPRSGTTGQATVLSNQVLPMHDRTHRVPRLLRQYLTGLPSPVRELTQCRGVVPHASHRLRMPY